MSTTREAAFRTTLVKLSAEKGKRERQRTSDVLLHLLAPGIASQAVAAYGKHNARTFANNVANDPSRKAHWDTVVSRGSKLAPGVKLAPNHPLNDYLIGGGFHPQENVILPGHPRFSHSATLAHEYGHAMGGISKRVLQSTPVRALPLLAVPAGLVGFVEEFRSVLRRKAEDRDRSAKRARNASIAAAAVGAVPMIEEVRAHANALRHFPEVRGRLASLIPRALGSYAIAPTAMLAGAATIEAVRRRALRHAKEDGYVKKDAT